MSIFYKENKISISNFDYVMTKKYKFWSKLKVYLNDKELTDFEKSLESITSFTTFFSRGRFFMFILLNKTTGLRILYNVEGINPHQSLKKIIKIQKIFYKNGVSFDCQDTILEIPITDTESNTQHIFLGYITNTDINFELQKTQYDLNEISNEVLNVCEKEHLLRSWLLREVRKYDNYVFTNKNEYKFIDIDPRFHFGNK